MCAHRVVVSISDLHQNDTHIGCLVARQTTDHWATGPCPGCDMTRSEFAISPTWRGMLCVFSYPLLTPTPHLHLRLKLADAHSSCHHSSTPVSSSSCLAPGMGRRLPDYTLRYCDIAIHWPTISRCNLFAR